MPPAPPPTPPSPPPGTPSQPAGATAPGLALATPAVPARRRGGFALTILGFGFGTTPFPGLAAAALRAAAFAARIAALAAVSFACKATTILGGMSPEKRSYAFDRGHDRQELGAGPPKRVEPVQRVAQVGVQRRAVLHGDGETEPAELPPGSDKLHRKAERHHLQEVAILGSPHADGLRVRGPALRGALEPGDSDAAPSQFGEQAPSGVRGRRSKGSSRGRGLHVRGGRAAVLAPR